MRDLIAAIQFDIDEMCRIAQEVMRLLSSAVGSVSPIRYRLVLEAGIRLRVLWSSHVDLSHQAFAYIARRDPRFKVLLQEAESEQERLTEELRLLTPTKWPRTTELGLNCLRARAFLTLPSLIHQLEHEGRTVLPLLQRWAFEGVAEVPAAEHEPLPLVRRMASA